MLPEYNSRRLEAHRKAIVLQGNLIGIILTLKFNIFKDLTEGIEGIIQLQKHPALKGIG